MPTIAQALNTATTQLSATSPTPRLDAQVLLAHVLNTSRAALLVGADRVLSAHEQAQFGEAIRRRAALEPVAYLVGHKEFYGLDLVVDQRVLVPRPETELLVDLALQWIGDHPVPSPQIADIGTGSGAIAVALAVHVPQAHIFAVDLFHDALDVARINAARHAVADRITFLQGDGCAPLPQSVDLFVTNPPYTIMSEIDSNVRQWEPHAALDGGGADGFAVPARLLGEMPPLLQTPGAVLMEIGAWQGAVAIETAQQIFPGARCAIHRDLAGLDRVLLIEREVDEVGQA